MQLKEEHRMKTSRLGILAVLLMSVSGCRSLDYNVLSDPGKNETLCVAVGDRYYFDLEENRTTGYSWEYTCKDDDIEVTIDHLAPEMKRDGEGRLCGAPGKASVRLRVMPGFDGPASVTFSYRRPWEKTPIKSFTLGLYMKNGPNWW